MRTLLFAAGAIAFLAAGLGASAWAQEQERERPVPEQVERLKMEAERQADSGHPDKAEALIAEAERLMRAEHGEHEEWGEDDERDEGETEDIHTRLRAMHAEIEELTDLGRHDEAEDWAREARQLEEALERDRGERPHEMERSPEGNEREEMERRMHHFRAAIENLVEAGAHDRAADLENQLAEMERHMERPSGPEAHIEELTLAVQQLHGQVRELREVVAHLQARVAELSE